MYRMNNYGNLFSYELANWLIYEAVFKQSQFQMYIYYKYVQDVSKLVVLFYVDACVYWYTSEKLGKWFVDILEKRLNMNLLRYSHWFMSIRIPQIKDHYISVDPARYSTSVVA